MFVSKCSRSLQILPIMLSTHLKTTPPCAGRAVEGRSLLYRLRSLWRQNHQDQSPYQNDSALKHNLSRNAISWRIMFYNWMCGVSEGIKSERLSPVTIMDAHRKKISSSLGCHETISWAPCWSDLHNLDQFVLKSNKWIIDTAHANNISAKPVDSLQRVAPETPAPQGAHHPPPPPAKFKSKHFNT